MPTWLPSSPPTIDPSVQPTPHDSIRPAVFTRPSRCSGVTCCRYEIALTITSTYAEPQTSKANAATTQFGDSGASTPSTADTGSA